MPAATPIAKEPTGPTKPEAGVMATRPATAPEQIPTTVGFLRSIHSTSIHVNAAILEVAQMSQLAELAADSKVRRYLLARLSDTAALVDPGREQDLEDALRAAGHTPKLLEGE